MMNIDLINQEINHLVTQARYDIALLSNEDYISLKPQILQRLWDNLSTIQFLSEMLANQASINLTYGQQPYSPINSPDITHQQNQFPITPLPDQTPQTPNLERTFTIQELAKYNGKNGMPAYVAVNDLVYDVTNNRAWAAATHFGLLAGRDYTAEFASCHTGQESILTMLPIVGRLV